MGTSALGMGWFRRVKSGDEQHREFYNEGPYQARVCGFFLVYHQVVA
jgi:hypothetical protein